MMYDVVVRYFILGFLFNLIFELFMKVVVVVSGVPLS